MLRNFFLIAWRNLQRNKIYSFINIAGLGLGIACALLIILYVADETSYDRYHKDAPNIYRVVKDFVNDDGSRLPDATTPPALAPAMQKELPEVDKVTRVFPGWGNKFLIRYGEKKFIEEKLFRVDSSFFDVFSFPFVQGNPQSAFTDANFILITESMAKKYFGSEDPMHKLLHTDFGDLPVKGILKDIPANSHFHFDFLISLRKFADNIDLRWGWYNFYTYIKFKPHTSIALVEPKIQALYKKNNSDGKNIFYTQALPNIHLDSDLKWEIEPNGNRMYVYIFCVIAAFIVVIACINYINLATAKSSLRAREIGIRKVAGAFRPALIRQFLIESLVTVLLAFALAIIIAIILLPLINQLTQKNLSLENFVKPQWLLALTASAITLGLIAGIYPAIYLSSFRPAQVLKSINISEKGLFNLRKVLVVFQFTISAALITGTLIIIEQIHFIQNRKLGLNKDQVLIISNAGSLSRPGREALRAELAETPRVMRAATSNGIVGGQNWTTTMRSKGSENGQLINFLGVSYDYLQVLGIELKEGRYFSGEFPADSLSDGVPGTKERISGGIIMNERALKDLGITEPAVGKLVRRGNDKDTVWYTTIIGVAKDFHFASLKNEIKPFAFMLNPDWQDNFTIKVNASNLQHTITEIEKIWKKYSPERPFQYSFLDETFAGQYKSEQRFNRIFLYITTLAIFIACMGLFGLTAYMVEKRTREIGIRKVIGASVTNILTLLSWDFVKLILLSILIATPISWWAMNQWLQGFVYRASINGWVFAAAAIIALIIAIVTISVQAFKAAMTNPVKCLRAE
jgi:putative ABC transport system permease protein